MSVMFVETVCLGCPENARPSRGQVDVGPAWGSDGGTYDVMVEVDRD